ncbi:hypothetical protein [Dyella sp. S184]|uniref:hypothetical protein n=1 Tax=Dyella sp. S184 TaxID=1641862 RepID=UPI00131CF376|nr:hypothetical protein [Dyella sp. S184]
MLAHQIAPHLDGLCWAIGGSSLLCRLGLEAAPADLDIVTTNEHFAAVRERLSGTMDEQHRPRHANYVSRHFALFRSATGVAVDVMAGIAVRTPSGIVQWPYSGSTIETSDDLPWMRAEEWLALYAIFNRPQRVEQLKVYLSARAARNS